MLVYQTVVTSKCGDPAENRMPQAEAQIAILQSQGKTNGDYTLTNPTLDTQIITRYWIDEPSANDWITWLIANNLPNAIISATVSQVEYTKAWN